MVSSKNKKKRNRVVDGSSLPETSKRFKVLGEEEKSINQPTEEELRLEEQVFGFVPDFKGKQKLNDQDESDSDSDEDGDDGTGGYQANQNEDLSHLPDDQLFSIDEPNQPKTTENVELIPHSEPSEKPTKDPRRMPSSSLSRIERKPAWIDDSVNQLSISLTKGPNRRKKLQNLEDLNKNTDGQVTITGEEYEKRLRNQFEKMNPAPVWLRNIRKSRKKAREVGTGPDEDEGQDGDSDGDDVQAMGIEQLLRSTGDLSGNRAPQRQDRLNGLSSGLLQVERLRDANQAESSTTKASISSLQFHPRAPILLTASAVSKRLSFFKIDGVHNPALHFVNTPDLPIKRAEFFSPINNQSSNVLMTGDRPYFYTFDMKTCQSVKSPQGLFNRSSSSQSIKGTSLSQFKFSPSGHLVAFIGLKGLIELVDFSNNISSSQVICSLKSNSPIRSLAWNRNGTELLSIGNDAEVSVWDLRMRRVIGSWVDDGGFHPTRITTTDQDCIGSRTSIEDFCAVGSQTGIVNIYKGSSALEGESDEDRFRVQRKLFKTIENVTTSISGLKFNPDGQILAISSETKKDSLKIVHLKTRTVFSNWPTEKTPLGNITDLSFDEGGSKLAIGNRKGKVLLYSLKHWSDKKKLDEV